MVDTAALPHPAVAVCWHAPAAGECRVRYRRRGTRSWIDLDPPAGPAPGPVPRRRGGGAIGVAAGGGDVGGDGDGGRGGSAVGGGGDGDGGGAGGRGAAAVSARSRDVSGLRSAVVWEGLAAASEYEVQLRVGARGAWGRSAWARTGGAAECPRAAGRALVATLGLGAAFFDCAHDRCYCGACYRPEWPDVIEAGEPRPYVIPRGWARFGLKLQTRAEEMGEAFFRGWCVGFHGAAAGVCAEILRSGTMLVPGDRRLDGSVLRSGRCAGRQDRVYYTSPSVRYAGLRFYAAPTPFRDPAGRDMRGQVGGGGRGRGRGAVRGIAGGDGGGRRGRAGR